MRMLNFTLPDGRDIWVNPKSVASVTAYDNETLIHIIGEDEAIVVTEDAHLVVRALRGS